MKKSCKNCIISIKSSGQSGCRRKEQLMNGNDYCKKYSTRVREEVEK